MIETLSSGRLFQYCFSVDVTSLTFAGARTHARTHAHTKTRFA